MSSRDLKEWKKLKRDTVKELKRLRREENLESEVAKYEASSNQLVYPEQTCEIENADEVFALVNDESMICFEKPSSPSSSFLEVSGSADVGVLDKNDPQPSINQEHLELEPCCPSENVICDSDSIAKETSSLSEDSDCVGEVIKSDDGKNVRTDSVLRCDLALWSVRHNITRNAVTELLSTLRQAGHEGLPKSSKTLLKTPRSTVNLIKDVGDGVMWYHGIYKGLVPILTEEVLKSLPGKIIEIDIFVDGVSPYKSTKICLWPICGNVNGTKEIFIIAMWCGKTKEPGSLNDFLEDFVKEANEMKNGFSHNGVMHILKIRRIIADASARAWIKNVNQHGSYNSCERCTVPGQWYSGRMTFPSNQIGILRTDESLQQQLDESHHKGTTPLSELGINQLSQIPLDPMHLLYLGVMKRILSMLLAVKKLSPYKFADAIVTSLDNLSIFLAQFYPTDFARRPRKLSEWALYKATEFRRFLLYDGFIILKKQPFKEVYQNFMLFACAIRILSDPSMVLNFACDAEVLLKKFVHNCEKIYGQQFNVFNVHHLLHLASECLRHGHLENFSAFKYESYLGQLKKFLHAPGRTVSQVVCRILEKIALTSLEVPEEQNIRVSQPHRNGPLINGLNHDSQFQRIFLPNKIINLSSQDNRDAFFLSNSIEIVKVENIVMDGDQYYIIGRSFIQKEEYFTFPVSSSLLNIYQVCFLGSLKCWKIEWIKQKVVLLPVDGQTPHIDWDNQLFLCLPILHSDQ